MSGILRQGEGFNEYIGHQKHFTQKTYYHLLASSYQRAEHLLSQTETDPVRQRDTMAYLHQLQKEMQQFAEDYEKSVTSHPGGEP
jgi:hypothetical protein